MDAITIWILFVLCSSLKAIIFHSSNERSYFNLIDKIFKFLRLFDEKRTVGRFRKIQLWLNAFLFELYDISGLRFIFIKIYPHKLHFDSDRKTPSTFSIWLIGLYFAAWGIASQRYENKIDVIENRTSILIAQTGTSSFKSAIGRIPNLQQRTIPIKPVISEPLSILYSLFGQETLYDENVELLKNVIVSFKTDRSKDKKDLSGTFLNNADLSQLYLSGANFREAFLIEANLSEANFSEANLRGAILRRAFLFSTGLRMADLRKADLSGANLWQADLLQADIRGANLSRVNFREAFLVKADLSGADLTGADLIDAFLNEANLRGVNLSRANLTGADLSGATWTYGTKFPDNTICAKGSIGKCIIEKKK